MKKFDDPSKLKDSIDVSLKRMGRVLFMPVTSAMRTARMFTQPSSIARKASNDVMGEIKKLKEPPSSLAEYVDGGSHYIARRLLYLLILAALILPGPVYQFRVAGAPVPFFHKDHAGGFGSGCFLHRQGESDRPGQWDRAF